MRQSTSSFVSWGGGGRPPQLDGRILDSPVRRSRARIGNAPIHFFFFPVGGGGPFQLDGRILDSPVRRSRARIGNAPIHFFFFFLGGGETPSVGWRQSTFFSVGGGGDPFSWMGAFLILRCGVRKRESGMRQSTSFFFLGGGGDPFQLDGRILDSPVRRSRARIGNAPIHFFLFFLWGGGRPLQLDGRILDSPVRRSRARIGNAPIHFFFFLGGGGTPFSWMGAFLILRCGVRERESGMRQSTSSFFSWGGETPSVGWRQSTFVSVGGGGDPFSWMGAFLILRCGVRERESGMRQSTSSFFSWGGGRPLSWMGAFLILRCGVRERESGMRQSTSFFFLWGGGVLFSHRLISRNIWLKAPFA